MSFRPMSLVKFDDLFEQLLTLIWGEVGVLDVLNARPVFARIIVADVRLHSVRTEQCVRNKRTRKPGIMSNVT